MPLQEQNIPLVLTKGINQKVESKILPPVNLSKVENGYQPKTGRFKKRNGVDPITTDILGGGSLSSGKGIFSYKDELLVVDNNKLYSYAENAGKWVEQGKIDTPSVSQQPIIGGIYGAVDQMVGYANGIELYAWISGEGGVHASVFDSESGTPIQNDVTIDAVADQCAVASCGNYIFVLYITGNDLKAQRLNTASPASFGSEFTIISGTVNTTPASPPAPPTESNPTLHACAYNSSSIFYAVVDGAGQTLSLGFLNDDESSGTTGTFSDTGTSTQITSCYTQTDGNNVYVVYTLDGLSGRDDRVILFGYESDLSTSLGTVDIENLGFYSLSVSGSTRACMVKSGTTMHVFYDTVGNEGFGANDADTVKVRYNTVNLSTWSAGTATTIANRSKLASGPWVYNSEVYVSYVYVGDLGATSAQKTTFAVKSDGTVVGKFFPASSSDRQFASDDTSPFGSLAIPINPSSGVFKFPILVASSFTGTQTGVPRPGVGLSSIKLDFTSNNLLTTELNNTLFALSNLLHVYDGKELVETGFHLYPEDIKSNQGTTNFNVTTQGDGSNPETTNISFSYGGRYKAGQSFELYNSSNALRTVGFEVDGDNGGGSFAITISINSYDTSNEVAAAAQAAINAHADFSATQTTSNITVTNAANGAATDANSVDLHDGSVAAGTYGYRVIYVWSDAQGNVYRSAPSPAISVTVGSTGSVSLAIPSLKVTKKGTNSTNLQIEVYRTENAGNVYYRVSDPANPLINNPDQDYVYFYDDQADGSITSNAILYTAGGILENIAPPSASAMCVYRNRLALGGILEDPYAIRFSKESVQFEGVQFNETLQKRVDPFGEGITMLSQLDEKLIIGKEEAMLYLLGDGPLDTGLNGSWSTPEILSRDIGCSTPIGVNYITGDRGPEGLIFKSLKGWYLMQRSLMLTYIGADVEGYNDETVTGSAIIPDEHLILFTHAAGDTLVFDTFERTWYVWNGPYNGNNGVTYHNGKIYLLDTNGTPRVETPGVYEDNGSEFSMKIATSWIQVSGIQGFQRIWEYIFLGNFQNGLVFNVRTYFDWDDTNYIDETYTPAADVVQFGIRPKRQKAQATKIEIWDTDAATNYEFYELNALTIRAGMKRGLGKLPSARMGG